jgi:hypothetical protein
VSTPIIIEMFALAMQSIRSKLHKGKHRKIGMYGTTLGSPLCPCLLLIGLLLDAPASAAPSQPLDACSLLRSEEISKAIGAPVGTGEPQAGEADITGDVSTVCLWLIAENKDSRADRSAPLGGRSFVILNVHQWPMHSDHVHAFLDAFRQAADRGEIPNKIEARNFGDEALWWGDGLAVRQGSVSFGLSIFTPHLPEAANGKREEELAPFILKRLAMPHPNGRS